LTTIHASDANLALRTGCRKSIGSEALPCVQLALVQQTRIEPMKREGEAEECSLSHSEAQIFFC